MQSQLDGSGVVAPGNKGDTLATPTRKEEWSVRDVATATLITLGIGFAFYLLFRFYMIVFLFFVAVTLAVAIRPLVDWLQKRGIRQEIGVFLILAVLLAGIGAFVWAIAPLMIEQVSVVVRQLPDYYSEIRNWLADSPYIMLRRLAFALPVVPALPV